MWPFEVAFLITVWGLLGAEMNSFFFGCEMEFSAKEKGQGTKLDLVFCLYKRHSVWMNTHLGPR